MVEDLSRTLLEFIDASIPTVQAAEALRFLAANRDRDFSPDETRRIPTRGQGAG
jgi:hypothetical protein